MIARILQEPHAGDGDDLYDLLGTDQIVVPSHWPTEIGNALLTNVRRRRIALSDVTAIIDLLCQFELTVSPPLEIGEIENLANFALRHDLTAYDAAYVHLALTQDARLATVDRAMRTAATRLNVSLLPV